MTTSKIKYHAELFVNKFLFGGHFSFCLYLYVYCENVVHDRFMYEPSFLKYFFYISIELHSNRSLKTCRIEEIVILFRKMTDYFITIAGSFLQNIHIVLCIFYDKQPNLSLSLTLTILVYNIIFTFFVN